MATIMQLPYEMIVHILENESISAADLIRFGSTCTKFQQLMHDNRLCKKKFYHSCSTAEKKYNREKQKKIFHYINFKEKIETGLYCIQKLQYYAFEMSENNFRDTDKEQLERLLRSIAEDSMTYYFVWDGLNRIFAQKSCELFFNLTREYNFKLIYCYLKQYRLIHKQIKFMKTKSVLEKQLTILAQYFQPHVSYSAVKTWLDSIAETVLFRLKDKYPAHSICSATLEQFSFWRDNNIDDNFWNETESKQIMCILEEYIFSELDIHKTHQLLMTLNLEVKYIKYITECFRRYLLTVTYHIVARRFGIRTVLVQCIGTWNTIAVMWKPKYNTNNWDNAEYFYISLNSNLLYPSNIIKERLNQNNEHYLIFTSFNDISIIPTLMTCLYHKIEFKHKIYCEWNFKIFLNILYQCVMKDVEKINIETEYKNITNTIQVTSNTVKELLKRRTKKVKFAVGMIVSHASKDYSFPSNHNGVIVGWHYKCSYDMMLMGKIEGTIMFPYLHQCFECYHFCICQEFSTGAHQVHYIILTENNQICYMQQDQLSICLPKEIDNIEIGRYFSSFEGTYYVPNEILRKYYPEDTAAIAEILAK